MEFKSDSFYKKWITTHSIINVIGLLIALIFENSMFWLLSSSFSFAILFYRISRRLNFKPIKVGYANLITMIRISSLLLLIWSWQTLTSTQIFIIFLGVISMDGLDGFVARRFNQSSQEGEVLDEETDAFMVLGMSYVLYSKQLIEMWILLPGGFRYLYQLLFFWLPNSNIPTKRVRATIAVIFFLSLVAGFILPQHLVFPVLLGSSLLILFSFGASFIGGIRQLI